MAYYFGTIAAVPTANKSAYLDHVRAVWALFSRHGATRMTETWGVDVPKGKVTDLHRAVEARDEETVVFAWVEFPDAATCDRCWQGMQSDPAMAALSDMPLDGKRTIMGGFEPVLSEGQTHGAPYYQGFLLAVPEANRSAYAKLAGEVWPYFQKHGCLGTVEGWGVDVARGKATDMYRATRAEAGEVPVFSWTAWPDRATCDAASKAMMAEMHDQPMPDMPFDGMRMMWGGFETLFDSDAD